LKLFIFKAHICLFKIYFRKNYYRKFIPNICFTKLILEICLEKYILKTYFKILNLKVIKIFTPPSLFWNLNSGIIQDSPFHKGKDNNLCMKVVSLTTANQSDMNAINQPNTSAVSTTKKMKVGSITPEQ